MPAIRPVRWPDDEPQLQTIDTSFTTPRVYRVRRDALSFSLVAETVDPPIRKSYGSLLAYAEQLRQMRHVAVAEVGHTLVGAVAADLTTWNRRLQVEHCYVAPQWRGRGVGRALIASVVAFARGIHARCVWLETQNTNYPAVQFYRRLGFRLCGLDERLYDLDTPEGKETALFFALDVAP